jgi:uncharacterized protein YndB with AHSA1/START domain
MQLHHISDRRRHVIERQAVLPVSAEELWRAITDPDEVGAWFGGEVDWDLVPGAPLHLVDGEGDHRDGTVEEVDPGHRLRFRWWPSGDEGQTSEVTYVVEPDDDGALLTVTERPLFAATACAAEPAWSNWDTRMLLLASPSVRVRC